MYQCANFFFFFFFCFFFFVVLNSAYLFVVGVQVILARYYTSRTHTHTHSVGLLWTGDRPVVETST